MGYPSSVSVVGEEEYEDRILKVEGNLKVKKYSRCGGIFTSRERIAKL